MAARTIDAGAVLILKHKSRGQALASTPGGKRSKLGVRHPCGREDNPSGPGGLCRFRGLRRSLGGGSGLGPDLLAAAAILPFRW